MRRPVFSFLFICAACLCLALSVPAAKAQQYPDASEPVRISGEISDLLLRQDIDGAVAEAAPISLVAPADLKEAFNNILRLSDGRYTDLVYSRLYGKTEEDIIYKLRFANAILFVRYLFHVDGGKWKLFDVEFKTESSEPFPKDWRHIYPK